MRGAALESAEAGQLPSWRGSRTGVSSWASFSISKTESAEAASIKPLIDLTAADMGRVNELILSKAGSDVEMIPEVANHLISSGGKRLRPMVTLAAAQMFGYAGDGHVKLATSVEFMHTATLLHDDVVDESDLRRGKKTARMIWGNQASVLVGDFLLGQAFRMMVDVGSLDALDILSTAASIIAEGEVMQLAAAKNLETTEDEHFAVIKAKTAALFSAAAEVGPVIAGAIAQRPRRAALLRHESRPRLPADRRRARLWRLQQGARQECRRRFPRGQGHAAGHPRLSPRHAGRARVLEARRSRTMPADDAALEKAIGLMTRHGAIADTIGRAGHFGDIARDALAPLEATPQKAALLDVIDFCISRVA